MKVDRPQLLSSGSQNWQEAGFAAQKLGMSSCKLQYLLPLLCLLVGLGGGAGGGDRDNDKTDDDKL